MKKSVIAYALLAVTMMVTAACDKRVVTELSECQRNLGANEVYLSRAKADQAAAEEKLAVLEEQLKATQEELANIKTSGGGGDFGVSALDAKGGPRSKSLRVGLSLPTQEERWTKDKLTMLAEAKKRGIELLVQVVDNNSDAERQMAQCDSLIANGIRVLIIAPIDAAGSAAIVDKAVKAGVHVISYDRLVTNSPHTFYYLSFDGTRVGAMQGEYLARRVRKGNYIVLAGSPKDNNAKLFRQGAMRVLQPLIKRGDIKVVMDEYVDGWLPSEAKRLCEQALAATPNIAAVLAPNDGTAGGCIEALTAKGLAGKVPVTGQDAELAAAIRILRGTQSMTVFKDTRMLGKKAIEMAADLMRSKKIDTKGRTINNGARQVPSVLLAPYVVTKENLDDRLIKTGYLNKEAVYRK